MLVIETQPFCILQQSIPLGLDDEIAPAGQLLQTLPIQQDDATTPVRNQSCFPQIDGNLGNRRSAYPEQGCYRFLGYFQAIGGQALETYQ